MRVIHAISLVVIAAASLAGLGLLLLHAQGTMPLTNISFSIVATAVISLLLLFGFFLGTMFREKEKAMRGGRDVMKRLRAALEIERRQRIDASRERYKLREKIVALETKLKKARKAEKKTHEDPAESILTEQPAPATELNYSAEEAAARDEIEELANRCDRLRSELTSRKERMVDLQAELSIAQTEAEEARKMADSLQTIPVAAVAPDSLADIHGTTVNEVLDTLVSTPGVKVALVADDQGLVVDKAGEYIEPDALAAVSGLVAELSPRVSDLLPIGEIATVALGDIDDKILEVRYFPLLGSRCALAIIRENSVPDPEITKTAIELIKTRLEG